VIHDLETLLSLGKINAAYIHDLLKLTLRVVPQESQNRDDGGRRDVQGQFVLENRELLNEFWQALGEVGAVCVESLSRSSVESFCRIWRRWLGERSC
jgi:hypothetical protein